MQREVFESAFQASWRIAEFTQSSVTILTQQTANFFRIMVVINCEVCPVGLKIADRTTFILIFQHTLVLIIINIDTLPLPRLNSGNLLLTRNAVPLKAQSAFLVLVELGFSLVLFASAA